MAKRRISFFVNEDIFNAYENIPYTDLLNGKGKTRNFGNHIIIFYLFLQKLLLVKRSGGDIGSLQDFADILPSATLHELHLLVELINDSPEQILDVLSSAIFKHSVEQFYEERGVRRSELIYKPIKDETRLSHGKHSVTSNHGPKDSSLDGKNHQGFDENIRNMTGNGHMDNEANKPTLQPAATPIPQLLPASVISELPEVEIFGDDDDQDDEPIIPDMFG
jgi:hypothetical protein